MQRITLGDVDEIDEYDRDDLVLLTPLTHDAQVYGVGEPVPDHVEDDALKTLVRGGHIGA